MDGGEGDDVRGVETNQKKMKEMQSRIEVLERKLTTLEVLSYIGIALSIIRIAAEWKPYVPEKNERQKTTQSPDSRD